MLTTVVYELQGEITHHPKKARSMRIGFSIDWGDQIEYKGKGLQGRFIDAADAVIDEIGGK